MRLTLTQQAIYAGIVAGLVALLAGELLGISSGFLGHFAGISYWYIGGYLFGALTATLYNDLVFGYLIWIERRRVKTVFIYDRNVNLNIIKDPANPPENAVIRIRDIRRIFRILSKEQMFVVSAGRLGKIEDDSVAAGLAPLLDKSFRGVETFIKAIESTSKEFREPYTPDMLLHFFESKPVPGYCELLEALECESGAEFENCLTKLAALLDAGKETPEYSKGKQILQRVAPFLNRYLGFENPNLYSYPEDPPAYPYTIAFVANPSVRVGSGDSASYLKDPIIENRHLFINSIHKALEVFESNEVLGRPEIWPRVRIVALFDESLASRSDATDYAMVQEYPHGLRTDDRIAENLLDPLTSMKDVYERMLQDAGLSDDARQKLLRETDVIFALSANTEFDRSTAHFTDWIEEDGGFRIAPELLKKLPGSIYTPAVVERLTTLQSQIFISRDRFLQAVKQVIGETDWRPEMTEIAAMARYNDWANEFPRDPNAPPSGVNGAELRKTYGRPYRFEVDPQGKKRLHNEINAVQFVASDASDTPLYRSDDGRFSCIHEYYCVNPGRVALNVLGADKKTYIHEFAHAMSSAFHGAIVDEYFDSLEIDDDEESETPAAPPFFINRIERTEPGNAQVTSTHRVFATLDDNTFLADREHPSARLNWRGYFPDRRMPSIPCTMDQSGSEHRFDELLGTFIYDRLLAKINRPAYTGQPGSKKMETAIVADKEGS